MKSNFERAQVILGKRYPDARQGDLQRYEGQFWKRVGDEWLETTGTVGDVLGRLSQATGLWKNKTTMRIGMRLVNDAVDAARREEAEQAANRAAATGTVVRTLRPPATISVIGVVSDNATSEPFRP